MSEAVHTDGIFAATIPVVMSFPQLFEPKAFMENGKAKGDPKYSANFLFDLASPELKLIKEKAAGLARVKWPDKPFFQTVQETGEKIPQILFPFTSGDKLADAAKAKKKDGEFQRGKCVISSRSKMAPRLSVFENGRVIELDSDVLKAAHKNKFYSGVEVLVEFNLVPYEAVGSNGKPGVTAYLNRVMSTGKGVRVAGGKSSEEAFRGYVGSVSADSPMGPGADADMSDLL